ncbi:MAG: hypothetical protein JNL88_11120, partial [Bacteroidia bacterium]|nr:hypothetical protein [Bacteroidia bacterium]
MKTFYLNLLMLFLYCMTHAQSNTHHPRFVTPNYQVYSSYRDGNTLYLGGAFNGVGYNTGALAGLSPQSDIPDFDLPFLNGTIYCVIPDNSGGWYVGGSFNYSDGVITRYNILKILANKTADLNFNCNVNSTVRALALGTNNLLYIGGSFSEINATSRSYLAAANKNTGALNAWNPVLNSSVLTLQLKDSLLVSGGQFTVVNNTIRNYLAVFNINTGALLKNYPGTNYHVNETYIHNNTVYAGGLFSYAGKYTGSAVKMQG